MKNNIRTLLLIGVSLFSFNVLAQKTSSNLPACQGANTSAWSQCFGTKNYPNGDRYAGEWLNGKANGQGTYMSKASRATYVGQFAADTFSGAGTMTWPWGQTFVGQWRNDSGVSGTATFSNGATANGIVKAAVFHLTGRQPQSDLPPCPENVDSGRWTMCFGVYGEGGVVYVGEYKNGRAHGIGTLAEAGSETKVGEFRNGIFVPLEKSASAPLGTQTHCAANEDVIFACTTGQKVVSVCASKDLDPKSGYMQYRFGQIGKIELAYPASLVNPSNKFQLERHTPMQEDGSRGALWELRFSIGNITYELGTFANSKSVESNLIVSQAGKTLADLKCNPKSVVSPDLQYDRLSGLGLARQ